MYNLTNDILTVLYWLSLVIIVMAVLPVVIGLSVAAVVGTSHGLGAMYRKFSDVVNAPKNRAYVIAFIAGGTMFIMLQSMQLTH